MGTGQALTAPAALSASRHGTRSDVVSLALAGGRGSRMRCEGTNKVCLPVDGVPAILRALRAYEDCGIAHHVIVIGALGEQVIETVGPRYPNVSFVHQAEPRGTGDATRCGARLLEALGYDGLVLVAMGDRLVAPHVIHRMMSTMRDARSDVVFLVGSREHNPSSGRVVLDDQDNVAAIVETSEIALSALAAELEELCAQGEDGIAGNRVLDCVAARFPSEAKAEKACGALISRARQSASLTRAELAALLAPLRARTTLDLWLNGRPTAMPAAQVESLTTDVNLATYLFRAPVLYDVLRMLEADNAQGELFLTDCAKLLGRARYRNGSPHYRLSAVRVDHPDESMSFNTPEELADIERRLHENEVCVSQRAACMKACRDALMPAREWHCLLSENGPELRRFMARTYGPVPALHEAKRQELLEVVGGFIQAYGPDRETLIVRAPGRVNLMGRHIDHRGGNTNTIAINDEVLIVASARDDDLITLRNTNENTFRATEFSISQDIADLDWADWLTCINSPKTLAMTGDGDWSNYVRAAALRLQQRFRTCPLRGADMFLHGSIPIGSGLSSSSAVVVGAAEALISLNGLPVRPPILVDLCGEGEWFVGTRGGAADHAAIKFGRLGAIAHVGFLPFEIKEFVPFPPGHCVVVCNSGIEARKSESARVTFNAKILGYLAGELILKRRWPEAAHRIAHLRDVTCENLGIGLDEFYASLKHLPLSMTLDDLLSGWGPCSPDDMQKLDSLVSALPDDLGAFDVRGVTLYGLAEIERSRRCLALIKEGDAEGFGSLWHISHDGDRIVSHDDALAERPFDSEPTDEHLDRLIEDARSGDPQRVASAQLHRQPGKYACSTREIDLIVDVARRHPGVLGAQLAGAGLGGCALILARDDCCDSLINTLAEKGFAAKRYYPVQGAGLVRLNAEAVIMSPGRHP